MWTAAATSAYSISDDRFGENLSDRMREVWEHSDVVPSKHRDIR